VLEGGCSLIEVQTLWNICDLADCHEALDVKFDLEEAAMEEAKRNAERRRND
jgi:hypothetical protein